MYTDGAAELAEDQAKTGGWRRFLPIAIIAVGAIAAFIFLREFISFSTLSENYQALTAWRDQNFFLAAVICMAVYILAVAFSVPGAVWLTLVVGFLFGTILGSVMVVVAATIGALAIFLAARTALGDSLRARAGAWITKMEEGFRRDEVSYLLIMRLVPVMPFFIANLVPAFLGARTFTYFWTTLIGIIPGTVVYVSIGAGLGTQLATGTPPDLGVIFEWHVLGPLLGLAGLAALPLVLKAVGLRSGGEK
ncbi:MAG: VTT domain-containing protein [Pseudomonadota bacterium]